METKVTVNLKKGTATVKTVQPLFDNPAKRFLIEIDGEGWSAIEKTEDGYYFKNYSGRRKMFVQNKKISEKEAKDTIQNVIELREE